MEWFFLDTRRKWILLMALWGAAGCAGAYQLEDFSSDGCSLFPDQSLILKKDWRECCLRHDMAYWQGGTKEERKRADEEFRECIVEKTGSEALADLMYTGVRTGGSPYFPTWYRWGYGWNYSRGYKPLTDQEKEEAEKKLKKYRK